MSLRASTQQRCFHAGPARRKVPSSRPICSSSVPATALTQPAKADPFATQSTYVDSWFDKLMIRIYSQKMAAQLQNVPVPQQPQYSDFVRISKEIMRGRSPTEQKAVVLSVLLSLLPPQSTTQFRKLFPPTQSSAELNAWFAAQGFGWLVGEMQLQRGPVQVAPGVVREQNSIVKIKKCRYLEASGCVGMCVNMCKVPTQDFFTHEFGLPLTMRPKFEDLSCEMVFGETPEPMAVDAAFTQPCFRPQCNIGSDDTQKPCSKLPQHA